MKFVIDQQLPSALVGVLRELGHEAIHVKTLGMREASDAEICGLARELGAAVITKDEDFVRLSATGPKVVRIRLGNCPNEVLFTRIRATLSEVVDYLSEADIVEVFHAQP